MEIHRDFSDLLACLIDEKVEFVLVGAYALALHGVPRATGDLDLYVRPTEKNAEAAAGAEIFRFGDLEVRYLGRDALIKNKRATGRTKDLADIEALGDERMDHEK